MHELSVSGLAAMAVTSGVRKLRNSAKRGRMVATVMPSSLAVDQRVGNMLGIWKTFGIAAAEFSVFSKMGRIVAQIVCWGVPSPTPNSLGRYDWRFRPSVQSERVWRDHSRAGPRG